MVQLSLKRHVNAPIDTVFAVASDFPNAADTISAITKMEMLTPGPVGVGTRFRETRRMFKKEATEEMEVVAFDPPHGYALEAESCGCRYHTEFRLREKDGGTEVEMIFEGTPQTFFAKVMSVLMRPMVKMMAKMVARDLDDLAAACEGRAAGSTAPA